MSSLIAIFFWRTNATGPPSGVSPAARGVIRYRFAIGRISWSTRYRSCWKASSALTAPGILAAAVVGADDDHPGQPAGAEPQQPAAGGWDVDVRRVDALGRQRLRELLPEGAAGVETRADELERRAAAVDPPRHLHVVRAVVSVRCEARRAGGDPRPGASDAGGPRPGIGPALPEDGRAAAEVARHVDDARRHRRDLPAEARDIPERQPPAAGARETKHRRAARLDRSREGAASVQAPRTDPSGLVPRDRGAEPPEHETVRAGHARIAE